MTIVQRRLDAVVAGVDITEAPEGLCAIHQPHCAAAIWQRQPLPRFQSWIDALEPERLPQARVILRPTDVHEAMLRICELYGTSKGGERDRLIDDVAALSQIFAYVMQAPYLRLRFDVVTDNSCRKFHTDTVTARLVCTYRGQGTQYGILKNGAEPRRIITVPTGSPIVLRGKLWPENPSSGLRHRSPPIEGTGETRLVLVLDPVLDLVDQPQEEILH